MTNGPVIRSRAPIPAGAAGIRTIAPTMGGGQSRTAARPAAGVTGYDAIREQQAREEQREAQRAAERADSWMPSDFYLPSPQKEHDPAKRQANIVILDAEPSFAIHEHSWPNPQTGKMGKGSFTTICLAGEGKCPGCEIADKDPYYALKLTVQDMRPYTNQNGVLVPHTRKLMTVKNKQQPYFFRQFEQRGTLRGMQLLMIRDEHNAASHGVPEFIDLHPEDVIMATFQHAERRAQQDPNRIVKQANEDCYPFDYAKLFPKLTYEELALRIGVDPTVGAPSAGYDQTWGQDASQFEQLNTIGMAGRAAAGRGGIQPVNRGSAHTPQYDERLDDDVPFDGGTHVEQAQEQPAVPATRSIMAKPAANAQPAARTGPVIRQRGATAATRPEDVPL